MHPVRGKVSNMCRSLVGLELSEKGAAARIEYLQQRIHWSLRQAANAAIRSLHRHYCVGSGRPMQSETRPFVSLCTCDYDLTHTNICYISGGHIPARRHLPLLLQEACCHLESCHCMLCP